ncbi:rhomboid family intramembrane serine protease [Alkalicoccus daliensis]|uniref:Membrane associated serine protease, rhomboid family n=1 Tax=Alkalicoccus daliensis TaxID=745820 RepID=A0A1H0ILT6_9BACI|nr:rhomboid family intramembrane serine protease [Alkalicoccus daliensis]SDO32315.1 Membrane associated serine protease, rhomboid family [Alkalicoccus daliensis]
MFLRNESFDEYIRLYKVVTALIAINLFFYLWTDIFTFLGGREIQLLGVGNNLAIAAGDWWRLITPIFLHGGLAHVAFNSFALFLFGPALEKMLGKGKFLMIYLGTGVLANIVFYVLGDPRVIHLGASGAVFGLFGVYVYMVLVRKDLISNMNSQLIMVIVIIGVVMTFINPGVNIIAHIFGLAAGAVLAPLFLAKVRYEDQFQSRRVHDPDEIGFDPDRWRKKENRKKKIWFYLACGLLAMVTFFFLVDFFLLP